MEACFAAASLRDGGFCKLTAEDVGQHSPTCAGAEARSYRCRSPLITWALLAARCSRRAAAAAAQAAPAASFELTVA